MSVVSNVRNWFRRSARRPVRTRLGLEPLDARDVPAALVGGTDSPAASEPLPVLMVIANQDFYYRDDARSGDAADYSAVVFVGGWGASSYQYAFSGTYANAAYNGSADARTAADDVWVDGKIITGQNFDSAR